MDIDLGGQEANDLIFLAPVETNVPFHPIGHPNITKDMIRYQVNTNESLVGAG